MSIQGIDPKLQINSSISIAHANLIGGEKQSYSIDGESVSYTADKSNSYITVVLGATYQLSQQARAYAHMKRFDSTDDIKGMTGNIGLVLNF